MSNTIRWYFKEWRCSVSKTILVCVLVFAGTVVACENSKDALSLKLVIDREVLAVGEELALCYVVKNEGDHPIYILAGSHCLKFTIYEFLSKKPLVLENPPAFNRLASYVDKNDLVLLEPNESYEFKECLLLKKEEDGTLFLEVFFLDRYRVPPSGITIGARFLSRKYNQEKVDQAGFNVKLYDGEDLYSEVTMKRDGDCLRKGVMKLKIR